MALALALGAGSSPTLAAVCWHPRGHVHLAPFGDTNGSGAVTVADAVCALFAVLTAPSAPLPECLSAASLTVGVDLNCDGALTVADAQLVVFAALGAALPATVDSSGDGCPDACAPCAPPGGSSCFIDVTCVPEGQASIADPCHGCDPANDAGDWSVASDLTPCGSPGEVCLAGACMSGAPAAPTNVSAQAGDARVTLSFSPPAWTGGGPITSYEIAVDPPGGVQLASGSPVEITGLVNQQPYTLFVRALNTFGASAWSAPAAATPLACLGVADGTPCADGDPCTVDTACEGGACVGTPLCDPLGACEAGPDGPVCACPAGTEDSLGDGTVCGYVPSCAEVFGQGLGSVSGVYYIDPDGPGGAEPFSAYCEHELAGGGWTLLYTASDDGQHTFTWSQRHLLSTDTSLVGSPQTPHLDYKGRALHDLPFQRLLFVHQPSGVWAEYAVDSAGAGFAALMASISFPQCPSEPSSGYPMVAGTLALGDGPTSEPGLCDLDLYFHLGDHDGGLSVANCQNLDRDFNNATFGPVWNARNNGGCHFDDPALAGTGPSYPCGLCPPGTADVEERRMGFGWPLGLNTGTPHAGENYLQVFARSQHGHSPGTPGTTCQSTREQSPSAPSGVYWIDPNGPPHDDAFEVYCEMDMGGGGWTLLTTLVEGSSVESLSRTPQLTGLHALTRAQTQALTGHVSEALAQYRDATGTLIAAQKVAVAQRTWGWERIAAAGEQTYVSHPAYAAANPMLIYHSPPPPGGIAYMPLNACSSAVQYFQFWPSPADWDLPCVATYSGCRGHNLIAMATRVNHDANFSVVYHASTHAASVFVR